MEIALIFLPLAAFVTSALTGVMGMGGGLLLLMVMSEFLPFAVLIPVHGINQLVTHFSRAVISIPDIKLMLVAQFAGGAGLGAIIGSQFVLSVSQELFKLLLGVFVLICLIQPKINTKIKIDFHVPWKWPIIGAITSFFGLFVGATGVLIAPFFMNEKLSKEQLIATKAACQIFIHGSKVIAFFVLGFVLGSYLWLIVLMCLMSFFGSVFAKRVLKKIPEKVFYLLFQTVIVILAARLIIVGFIGVVSN